MPPLTEASGVVVRVGRHEDVPAVARVFAESMPVSVWARMGGRMAETYVDYFACQGDEILLVAEHPQLGIVGGCMGTMRPGAYMRTFYGEQWRALVRALARDLVDRPSVALTLGSRILAGVVGKVRCRFTVPSAVEHLEPSIPYPLPEAGLLTVYFVLPAARGRRLSARLTELCVVELRRRGANWVEVHVSTSNHASLATMRHTDFTAVVRSGDDLIFARYVGKGEARPVVVRVLEGPGGEPSLPILWAELWAKTPEGSGFESWPWVGAHLPDVSEPKIAIVSRGARPVAIFALELEGKRLTWLTARRSNYCGPVYDPEELPAVVEGFDRIVAGLSPRTVDLGGLRERSPFFAAIRSRLLAGLGAPAVSNPIGCPEVDLRPGWKVVFERQKSRQRNTWRRKRKKLGRLGELVYEELCDADSILAVMPAAVELYESRWKGLNVQKPFGRDDQPFQRRAAAALAADSHVRMSVLWLDGELIAFSYSVRANGVSSSYALAHDDRYAPFSPGLLLLLEILEHAAARGDPMFDFSLGDAAYKDLWATGRQEIYRVVWGAGARRVTAADAVISELRRHPRLRELKQRGIGSLVERASKPAPIDWCVQCLGDAAPDAEIEVSVMGLKTMREYLDDDRFTLAMGRAFRGDELLLLSERGLAKAIVWRVTEARRAVVTGGLFEASKLPEYVHVQPLALGTGVDLGRLIAALGPGIVVSEGALTGTVLNRFQADLAFKTT